MSCNNRLHEEKRVCEYLSVAMCLYPMPPTSYFKVHLMMLSPLFSLFYLSLILCNIQNHFSFVIRDTQMLNSHVTIIFNVHLVGVKRWDSTWKMELLSFPYPQRYHDSNVVRSIESWSSTYSCIKFWYIYYIDSFACICVSV